MNYVLAGLLTLAIGFICRGLIPADYPPSAIGPTQVVERCVVTETRLRQALDVCENAVKRLGEVQAEQLRVTASLGKRMMELNSLWQSRITDTDSGPFCVMVTPSTPEPQYRDEDERGPDGE